MTFSVDERDRIESALRAHQTKLSMAVAIAHLGVWELNLVSKEFTASDEVKVQFGLSPLDSLTFDRLFELIHPDDRSAVINGFRGNLSGGKDHTAEFRIIVPSGETRWLSTIGRCVAERTQTILGVCIDVTARKKNAEVLEKTVAQRTAALHETIAELEAFSYSISHDMRAPLRAMRCFSEIVMKDCEGLLAEETLDYLRRIAAAGERMDQLIQDVLTFSRISRSDLRLEPVNLDRLVRGILECYPNVQPPHAEITVEGKLPFVTGNPAALTQCISNLLGNAVKFVAPDTKPRILIWAGPIPDGDILRDDSLANFVRLYVRDNGIGIAANQFERIFGIFQQLHRGYEGTGIGLPIVKKAAERMGGKVGLLSILGKGSTFWLDLPGAVSEVPNGPKRTAPIAEEKFQLVQHD